MDSVPDVACGPALPAELGRLLRADLDDPVNVHLLVAALESLCGLVLAGFVLYGSAARGAPSPGDIDALVVTALPAGGGLWGQADGVEVDFHVIGLDALLESPTDRWPHLRDARPIYDATGKLGGWVEALRRAGPPPVPASARLREQVWARRMLRRVADRRASEPGVAAMRAAELLVMLPEVQAAVSGVPRGSVSGWFRGLDAETQALVLTWAEAPLGDAGLDALQRLVERVG